MLNVIMQRVISTGAPNYLTKNIYSINYFVKQNKNFSHTYDQHFLKFENHWLTNRLTVRILLQATNTPAYFTENGILYSIHNINYFVNKKHMVILCMKEIVLSKFS